MVINLCTECSVNPKTGSGIDHHNGYSILYLGTLLFTSYASVYLIIHLRHYLPIGYIEVCKCPTEPLHCQYYNITAYSTPLLNIITANISGYTILIPLQYVFCPILQVMKLQQYSTVDQINSSARNKDQKLVGRFLKVGYFTDCYPIVNVQEIWPTKMDFGWSNAEIGWKMANGRLLFLALLASYKVCNFIVCV